MYLLELPHVEQLDGPLRLQLAALGKLQNLAGDRGVLAGGGRLKFKCKVNNGFSFFCVKLLLTCPVVISVLLTNTFVLAILLIRMLPESSILILQPLIIL